MNPCQPAWECSRARLPALEILNRDGWCIGMLWNADSNTHCLAGAINLAATGSYHWDLGELGGVYETVAGKIREMFPYGEYPLSTVELITSWNDLRASEEDVRALLEKLAAG